MIHTKGLRALALSLTASLTFGGMAFAAVSDDCTADDKAAMAAWFPVDQVADPGTTLPSDSLCAFHVWSSQMFLWLTANDPDTGQMRLLGMSSLDELFEPTGMDKMARTEMPMTLSPRVSKDGATDLSEIMQAGSRGLLVDQQGRIVYYEQLFNDTFVDFTRSKFFTDGTFDPTKLAAATGLTEFFPAGAMELKTSWMILPDGVDASQYFTVNAEVFKLGNQDGKIVVTQETMPATVALVGLHIAATVDDHPEMIWATIEHIGNSPDLPQGMSKDSADPVSTDAFTFYTASTPANAGNVNAQDNLMLDESTQVLTPITNVFRQFAHGTTVGGKDWELNIADIQAVNTFWQDNFAPSGNPAEHYFEVGSVWMTPNSLTPDLFPITQLRGSTILSNSTMETYTQNDQQCFSCHNSLPVEETVGGTKHTLPGTNFNISHALVIEYFRTVSQQQGLKVRATR